MKPASRRPCRSPATRCDGSSARGRERVPVEASLSLGGSGNGGGLHRHGSGGGLVVGVGGDLESARPRRHQADGVAGEQRQVLGVEEERGGHQVGRAGARGVGEEQVAAV